METETLAKRNVAILFDETTNDHFIRLSEAVADEIPSDIRLNGTDMLPHVSLYNTWYPERSVQAVADAVCMIMQNVRPFPMRFRTKETVTGYTFVDTLIDAELRSMHKRVMDTLNPLREGAYDPAVLNDPSLTDAMREKIRSRGAVLVDDLFLPHVTVAHPKNPADCDKALDALPEKIDLTVVPRSIALVETGPYGTCKRIIDEFPLR